MSGGVNEVNLLFPFNESPSVLVGLSFGPYNDPLRYKTCHYGYVIVIVKGSHFIVSYDCIIVVNDMSY